MAKLKPIYRYGDNARRKPIQYMHWCPACQCVHIFTVVGQKPRVWDFDGNMEKPTFAPSMRLLGGWDTEQQRFTRTDCHYFIKKGMIEYCKDHPKAEWRKKTIPLPDLPEED